MADEGITTIQISKSSSQMLEELADAFKRSKKAQADWLIEKEYSEWQKFKLVGPKAKNWDGSKPKVESK